MADAEPNGTNGVHSDTISTVSEDTQSPPESPAWESSILGNTSEAKKARKKERHERNIALADHKSEKRKQKKEREEKRAEREERRQKKAAQDEKRGATKEEIQDPDVKNAAILDLDLEKYKKKLQNGQIKFEGGKPVYLSKKDLKKLKKTSEPKEDVSSKKRKLVDDEDKPKKKKKKSKA
jgi:nucleolar protein 58